MEPSSWLSSITLKIGKNDLEGRFYKKKLFIEHLIAYSQFSQKLQVNITLLPLELEDDV
jgi:hypothetical protein